jgi:hypothetical protein
MCSRILNLNSAIFLSPTFIKFVDHPDIFRLYGKKIVKLTLDISSIQCSKSTVA